MGSTSRCSRGWSRPSSRSVPQTFECDALLGRSRSEHMWAHPGLRPLSQLASTPATPLLAYRWEHTDRALESQLALEADGYPAHRVMVADAPRRLCRRHSSTRRRPTTPSWPCSRRCSGHGRDVCATRWRTPRPERRGGRRPHGGWARQRSPQDYLPLTDDVFATHLQGRATIGIYPLLRGDTCTLLACDFDKGTWVLDALAYLDACHTNGVPAALETLAFRKRRPRLGLLRRPRRGDRRPVTGGGAAAPGDVDQGGAGSQWVFADAEGRRIHPHAISQSFERMARAPASRSPTP